MHEAEPSAHSLRQAYQKRVCLPTLLALNLQQSDFTRHLGLRLVPVLQDATCRHDSQSGSLPPEASDKLTSSAVVRDMLQDRLVFLMHARPRMFFRHLP